MGLKELVGANKRTTRWHMAIILLAAYVATQPLFYTRRPSYALGSFVGAAIAFFFWVRVMMAVFAAIERNTSLWPSRIVTVQAYSLAAICGLLWQAFTAFVTVQESDVLMWATEPVPSSAFAGVLLWGLPLLGLYSVMKWVYLRWIADEPASPTPKQPTSEMQFCPRCGNRVARGHNFCPTCGEPVGRQRDGTDAAAQTTRHDRETDQAHQAAGPANPPAATGGPDPEELAKRRKERKGRR